MVAFLGTLILFTGSVYIFIDEARPAPLEVCSVTYQVRIGPLASESGISTSAGSSQGHAVHNKTHRLKKHKWTIGLEVFMEVFSFKVSKKSN